jgi:hypothetical protein
MKHMGRVVVAVAILGAVLGVAAVAANEVNAISANTSADIALISLAVTSTAVVAGFAMRRRWRGARDGMYVGLATLGAWFLLLLYALGVDTP